MSLPLSGISLKPYHPYPKYKTLLDHQPDYCDGSVDTYRFTYEALQAFIAENVGRIFNDSTKTMKISQKMKRSISPLAFKVILMDG
jgi:hypothetical protein